MTSKLRTLGFTLIELMIVVAVIAVLAGIAFPSYRNYILKGNRASAQAFLMDAAQRQAQYFLDNRSYAPDVATLFGSASLIPADVNKNYQITIATAVGPPPTFSMVATPQGSQATNDEQAMTITQSGAKTPSAYW